MSTCNSVSTPLEAGVHYSHTQSDQLTLEEIAAMSTVPYKHVLGTLQYLVTCTRWNIVYSINHLAQFMMNPAPLHWLGVKRIFRYLKGTMKAGLTFCGSNFQSSSTHHITG